MPATCTNAQRNTCKINGIILASDSNELLGRFATNFPDGPWRPIVNAKLAVIIKSMYKNWKLPKIEKCYSK